MAQQKKQKKRPYYGGGMPKGHKTAKVLEKEAMRAALRQRVFEAMTPMVDAQIAAAQGVKYLVGRAKKGGKFIHLTAEQVQAYLDRPEGEEPEFEVVEMWEKVPSTQAFTDLLDRTLDKAAQPVKVEGDVNLNLKLEERLQSGRKRMGRAGH